MYEDSACFTADTSDGEAVCVKCAYAELAAPNAAPTIEDASEAAGPLNSASEAGGQVWKYGQI